MFYRVRKLVFNPQFSKRLTKQVKHLKWEKDLLFLKTYLGDNTFQFLNISHQFTGEIDWNFRGYGKLWTYNLNYFDFLNQKEFSIEDGLGLIENYIEKDQDLLGGKEPYPISLRGMNWIKFLSKHQISNPKIDQYLYHHYQILSHNLEYHLLGNHLLENGFSLLFGGYYFQDESLYDKACRILKRELEEQILKDGAHFELSPMYHQIILYRLLDCINLMEQNDWVQEKGVASFFKNKASKMLSWLETVSYRNGTVPRVNDSTAHISASPDALFGYAEKLGLEWRGIQLADSGYRKMAFDNYEAFIDVGKVGPGYQPGHAHADTFSFELHFNNQSVVVDPGISTYESNATRDKERSTAFHNTVTVMGRNSSEVWGGFRMANRANVDLLIDEGRVVSAIHDGYQKQGIRHKRTFKGEKDVLTIEDEMIGKTVQAEAHFHFHPDCRVFVSEDLQMVEVDDVLINFKSGSKITTIEYDYAIGFNNTVPAKKIRVDFDQKLITTIKFNA